MINIDSKHPNRIIAKEKTPLPPAFEPKAPEKPTKQTEESKTTKPSINEVKTIQGIANEVKLLMSKADEIQQILATLPDDQLTGPEGLELIKKHRELTSPTILNELKQSLDRFNRAIEDNSKHDARSAIASVNNQVFVFENNKVKLIPREKVNTNIHRPLTCAELIVKRETVPELAFNDEAIVAIGTIEGMSRIEAHLKNVFEELGKIPENNFNTNKNQLNAAIDYAKESLNAGMLETLRNQAMLYKKGDDWVEEFIRKKAKTYLDIDDTSNSKKSDNLEKIGLFGNIALQSPSLSWNTLNLVSKDKTKKQTAFTTTVPPKYQKFLQDLAEVKYPGEKQSVNRSLAEVNDKILLADGTEVYSNAIENSNEMYLTNFTGRVVSLPDPLYKDQYESYMKELNMLNKSLQSANNDLEKEAINRSLQTIKDYLDVIPTTQYYEYIVVTHPKNLKQKLFTQINSLTEEEENIVSGFGIYDIKENNPFGIKYHLSNFYNKKHGNMLTDAAEFPVFIRIDNSAFMDESTAEKYNELLIERRKKQEEAQERLIRLTSESITQKYIQQ